MEEKHVNAKCPHCGAELFVGYNQGVAICTVCRKEFDAAKATKLYQSLTEKPKEEKKSASFGEEYLEVENIITRAEYYFERREFRKAQEELEKGLAITNTDYRLYFGLVRVETKDLTDYKNTSHQEYLNKAIECADADGKKAIMRLYKNFYQLSKLSEEEILQYKQEENVAIKAKLEEKFKTLIPFYMKKEKSLKRYIIFSVASLIVGIALIVLSMIFDQTFLSALGVVFVFLTYFFIRNYFSNKKSNKLFNALLDIYDALVQFDLSVYQQRAVLDQMKVLRKAFEQKNNVNQCEDELAKLCAFLVTKSTESSRRFIISHPVLQAYSYVQEESEN